jgi:transcriptional regulator with XRE-family HTH domain
MLQFAWEAGRMAIMHAGKIIRQYRKKAGLTQKQLCGTDCDSSTLRRIENGERSASVFLFAKLLSKLGINPEKFYISIAGDKEIEFFNCYYEIEGLTLDGNWEQAEQMMPILAKHESKLPKGEGVSIRKQMVLALYCGILAEKETDPTVLISEATTALTLTLPNLSDKTIAASVMAYDEIALLNILACGHNRAGDTKKAISILESVQASIESFHLDGYEKSRGCIHTLYNLSTFYGFAALHEEALRACNTAIKYCVMHKRLFLLPHIKFNKACALHFLGKADEVKTLVIDSICALRNNENYNDAQVRRTFAEDVLEIKLPA